MQSVSQAFLQFLLLLSIPWVGASRVWELIVYVCMHACMCDVGAVCLLSGIRMIDLN